LLGWKKQWKKKICKVIAMAQWEKESFIFNNFNQKVIRIILFLFL